MGGGGGGGVGGEETFHQRTALEKVLQQLSPATAVSRRRSRDDFVLPFTLLPSFLTRLENRVNIAGGMFSRLSGLETPGRL